MAKLLMLVCVSSLIIGAWAQANPPPEVVSCTACHGAKGISPNSLWPNLNGQKMDYLIKQLNDFKEGRRNDPLMSPMAKTLGEKEIETVAKYFSSL